MEMGGRMSHCVCTVGHTTRVLEGSWLQFYNNISHEVPRALATHQNCQMPPFPGSGKGQVRTGIKTAHIVGVSVECTSNGHIPGAPGRTICSSRLCSVLLTAS